MSRGAHFRRKPPDDWDHLVASMEDEKLLLVASTGPTSFVVRASSGRESHKVCVGQRQLCSCHDPLDPSTSLCVHICFVMLKVLRVPREDPLAWQLSLVDSEINAILQGRLQRQERQLRRRTDFLRRKDRTGQKTALRAKLEADEICPICQCALQDEEGQGYEGLDFCRTGCGNNMHVHCMRMYCEHYQSARLPGSRAAPSVPCPLCRSNWPPHVVAKLKESQEQGKGGEKGTGRKKKLLTVRCQRCQIMVRARFFRCLHCASRSRERGTGLEERVRRSGVEDALVSLPILREAASDLCVVVGGSGADAETPPEAPRKFSLAPHDLCSRCFQAETATRGSHDPGHLWVSANAISNPVRWEAALPASRTSRSGMPASVISAMQHRERLTDQDLALLLELERKEALPNLHEHLVQSLPAAEAEETVRTRVMRRHFQAGSLLHSSRSDHLLRRHLQDLENPQSSIAADASSQDAGGTQEKCGLCLAPLHRESSLRRGPCGHLVHQSCLVDRILERTGSGGDLCGVKCKLCDESCFPRLRRYASSTARRRKGRPETSTEGEGDKAEDKDEVAPATGTLRRASQALQGFRLRVDGRGTQGTPHPDRPWEPAQLVHQSTRRRPPKGGRPGPADCPCVALQVAGAQVRGARGPGLCPGIQPDEAPTSESLPVASRPRGIRHRGLVLSIRARAPQGSVGDGLVSETVIAT